MRVWSQVAEVRKALELVRRENAWLRRELRTLRQLVAQDHLTGLWNRRFFDRRLAEEVSRCRRGGSVVSIVVLDIDDFKRVNDTFGHDVGDQVLVWVGSILAACLRRQDVPCRWGGDEFAVILPDTDASGLAEMTARLRSLLVEAAKLRWDFPLTVSVGTATASKSGADAESLLKDADVEMYSNKPHQQNQVAMPGVAISAC